MASLKIFSQKRRLIDAFIACPSMSDRETRNNVVDNLPDVIKTNIRRNNRERIDVENIIQTCLNYPGEADEPSGFDKLVEIVSYYDQGTDQLKKLEETITCIFYKLIEKVQQDELIAIASQVICSDEELRELYKESLPDVARLDDTIKTLKDIVEELLDIKPHRKGKMPPLLFFVELLARKTDKKKVSNQLTAWTEQIAHFLKLEQADIDEMRTEFTTVRADKSHISDSDLMIIVKECEENTKLFSVDILLWNRDDTKPIPLYRNDENKIPFKGIPELLNNIIQKSPELKTGTKVIIEFFLPHHLLSHTIDQWCCIGRRKEKLGKIYPVVVRSLDRIVEEMEHHTKEYWHEKSQNFRKCEQSCSGLKENTSWISDHQTYDPDTLFSTLHGEGDKFCVGLAFLPTYHPDKFNHLDAVIEAGTPVAFWPRTCGSISWNSEEIQSYLTDVFSDRCLVELPSIIWKKIRKPSVENPLGNHLTLLWDHYDRLPPEYDPDYDKENELYDHLI